MREVHVQGKGPEMSPGAKEQKLRTLLLFRPLLLLPLLLLSMHLRTNSCTYAYARMFLRMSAMERI